MNCSLQLVTDMKYAAPSTAAKELETILSISKRAKILDIGAGTGLCGVEVSS